MQKDENWIWSSLEEWEVFKKETQPKKNKKGALVVNTKENNRMKKLQAPIMPVFRKVLEQIVPPEVWVLVGQ